MFKDTLLISYCIDLFKEKWSMIGLHSNLAKFQEEMQNMS